jgi:hypothetical protein
MARDGRQLAGRFAGRALLVLGSAACLWDDLAAAGDDGWVGDRMAVNLTAINYDRHCLRHWATVHPQMPLFQRDIPWWRHRRDRANRAFDLHGAAFDTRTRSISLASRNPAPADIWEWPYPARLRQGSSSLFAVEIGLVLGYDPIVLCGVPLDDSDYFFRRLTAEERETYGFRRRHCHATWERQAPGWAGRVKSMSGFTAELLGRP